LKVIRTLTEYNQWHSTIDAHAEIGFVPTMGALHQGHLSLIRQSTNENHLTVCSIYINPTQFDKKEDLIKYPKSLKNDISLLKTTNCDVLFVPNDKQMYPEGEDLTKYEFDFSQIDTLLEGKYRKGHFRGVGIIVGKFFEMLKPTKAYLGEKDYQQLQIVRRLATAMKLNLLVIGSLTVRESDGLAMSSRNLRLNRKEREEAVFIYQMLQEAKGKYLEGEAISTVKTNIVDKFNKHSFFKLDYFEIVHEETFLASGNKSNWRCFVAAFIGPVRLIDNMSLIA
jgi:pantoate--beta-alanine ligase